ncbi:MAG: 16S rRNA (adenine(1518)-N(6)/adenine(1519)-N(6))-dimethyltransferase RsmA [DPANN group archaeon]|nr:16S rRNA (adenine(1518)-N(6)/adenine(1519)-N(6))-dimethyltransferase RsmA [DPANN group archaeon]
MDYNITNNVFPKKALSQNFLKDKNIIDKEIAIANINENETILEIGPGLGALTFEIAKKAKKVIAIEKDKDLVKILKTKIKYENIDNVEIIEGDILKTEIPAFDKCISNIPYQISSKITELLGKQQKLSILIYQKEFAERLVAKVGSKNYSRISILAQYHFKPKISSSVSKKCFYPIPKVNSAIVVLEPRKDKPTINDVKLFFNLVRGLFTHKNQKVSKAFEHSKREFAIDKKRLKEISKNLKWADMRVRDLDTEKLAEIANDLFEKGFLNQIKDSI